MNPNIQFQDAMRAAGLEPPPDIHPGKFHRFASPGKPRTNKSAWCKLFDDGQGGVFGDWSTGLSSEWQASRDKPATPAERKAFAARVEQARKEAAQAKQQRQAKAARWAADIWTAAHPAPADSVYLVKKGIQPHNTRLRPNGWLLVPMRDTAGKLWNLERIAPEKPADGSAGKKGLYGGRRNGLYFSIGNLDGAAVLCICEGFATGATIHEATGYPVAVAFTAGNLEDVATALRAKFPALSLILCADDDVATDGNPGKTKATEAAKAVGGVVALPDFGNPHETPRTNEATDFNDMAALYGQAGLQAVQRAITSAAASLMGEPQPQEENPIPDDSEGQISGEGDKNPIPSIHERPRFLVFEDWLEHGGMKYRPGVWYFGIKNVKGDAPPELTQSWVCSPLTVQAVTFDGQDNNFGRLLRFKNSLGRWREWAMPMELLKGDGSDLRGELLSMGVEIDPLGKTLLANYLQAKPPKHRMRCALQVGWCEGSFVLPDAVIGPKAAGVIFQSGERGHDEHTTAGNLADWQKHIAALAVGNPWLSLALSAAFAGPMLARCNAEGGGVHFVGDSSTGKTTAIEAACSIWGGPNFKRSWRATANGMEGAAALFNDCLLALDEISECDPKEVGAIVYALGNGRGKQRASRTGQARGVTRWRCVVLSSGERTIATTMQEGGHRAKAGQSVRLLDIPAARAYGAWDTLHHFESGTALSDALKREASHHYGHAGRAFLEKLTRDERDFCALLERIKGLPDFAAGEGEGQDKRAAGRFALMALAGEVATEYGLTGWPEGEAVKAAAAGFKAWQTLRGRGNDERRQILERVTDFIERHGDSRFSDVDNDHETQVRDRAGWWRDSMGSREYLFTAAGLRESLKGFDFGQALDALQDSGVFCAPGANGERAKPYRISGRVVKLYPMKADKLGAEHGA